MRLVGALVACFLLGLISCQLDCDLPMDSDIANVIGLVIRSGENPQQPQITLVSVRHVCRAFSEESGRYRFVSVLVEYMCEGNANCPTGTATEQLETGCLNGNWSNNVRGSNTNIRTQNPTATFSTTLREDCSFCISPELAPNVGVPEAIAPDDDHHCVACDSSCEGLMRCHGIQADECCNFYNNSECVVKCPSPFVRPNSNNTCDCPLERFGYNCSGIVVCNGTDLGTLENGDVMFNDTTFDSVATYSCDPTYALNGNATRRCLADGTWSGNMPSCVFVECGSLNDPDNGKVTVKETFLGSVANYSCDPGYTRIGDEIRTCLRDGTWSGNEPICTGCKVPNCAICDTIDTCKECLSFYEPSDNICKCPVKGCDVCDKDGTKCDQCENNGRFDESQSACITGGDDEGDDEGDGGLSPGAIAGIIIALIVLAILLAIAIALISYFAKRYWDKIHLKKTSLEAPKGDFRDNQLYVGPEELADDVDRGVTTPAGESDGISPSNGAVDSNGSE